MPFYWLHRSITSLELWLERSLGIIACILAIQTRSELNNTGSSSARPGERRNKATEQHMEGTQLSCHKPDKPLALSPWKEWMVPLRDCLSPSCVYPRRTKADAGQGGWGSCCGTDTSICLKARRRLGQQEEQLWCLQGITMGTYQK